MSVGDVLGWGLCLGVLAGVAALFTWLVRRSLAEQKAFEEALTRRGWGVPPGEQDRGHGQRLVARGVHQGRPFEVTTWTTRGRNSRTTAKVRVPSGLPSGRVVVGPVIPDSGILGAAVSFLLGGELPPVWDGAPLSLSGKWQVRGPPSLAAAVASPALVEALLRWDRNAGMPWLETDGGAMVLTSNTGLNGEAHLVAMVELTIAAAGPAPV